MTSDNCIYYRIIRKLTQLPEDIGHESLSILLRVAPNSNIDEQSSRLACGHKKDKRLSVTGY